MDNNYKDDLYNYFQEDKKFQERYLNGNLLDEYKNELISTKNFENLKNIISALKDGDYTYICFLHHNDLDGVSSASVMYTLLKDGFSQYDLEPSFMKLLNSITVESIKWNYSAQELNNNIIPRIKESITRVHSVIDTAISGSVEVKTLVIMTDLSFDSFDTLESIVSLFDDSIWIDHHNTSLSTLEEYNKLGTYTKGFFYVNTKECATLHAYAIMCVLYSEIKGIDLKDVKIPGLEYSALVSLYDLKQDKIYSEFLMYIANSLNQLYWDYNPQTAFDSFFTNIYSKYSDYYKDLSIKLYNGQKFLEFDKKKKELLFMNDFEYQYKINLVELRKQFDEDGVNTIFEDKEVVNDISVRMLYGFGNSSRFIYADKNDKNIIYGIIKYSPDNANIVLSTYTDDVDIQNEINLGNVWKFYGIGGGHPGASGCSLPVYVVEALSDIFAIYGNKSDDTHQIDPVECVLRIQGIIDMENFFKSYKKILYKLNMLLDFLRYTKEDGTCKYSRYFFNDIVTDDALPEYKSSINIRYDANINKAVNVFTTLIAMYIILKHGEKK